jgi:hypothetical protein
VVSQAQGDGLASRAAAKNEYVVLFQQDVALTGRKEREEYSTRREGVREPWCGRDATPWLRAREALRTGAADRLNYFNVPVSSGCLQFQLCARPVAYNPGMSIFEYPEELRSHERS